MASDPPLVRLPTRQEVRGLVARNLADQRAAMARGENPHQLALDQQDRVSAYADLLHRTYGADTALVFLGMVTDEQLAAATHLTQQAAGAALEADQRRATATEHAATLQTTGGVVMVVVLALVLYLLVRP